MFVRSADGSIRDGLSLLDQAIANEGGIIKINSIIKMLGLADRNNIFDLLDFIFQGNVQESLNLFSKIHNGGADVVMIFEEMLNVVHFITQVKIAPDLREDIHIPELERIRGFEISEKISMSSLGLIWQVLFKGYEELQSGYHLFQHGEMIIIRLIYLYEGPSPDDLVKKTLEKKFDEKIIIKNQNDKNNDQNDTTIINQNINQGDKNIKSFRNLVDLFYQNKEGMLHTYLYNNVKLVSFKEGELVINTKSITDPQFSRTIAKLISKWTGRIWQVSTSSSNIGQSLQEEDLINQQKQIEKIKDDPEIKSILTSFPGVKIHSITDINETTEEKNNILQIKNTKE